MKTKFIFGILAVASLSFTACSNDDIPEEVITPNPGEEVQPESAVQELGIFNFTVNTGDDNEHGAASRTPSDVDNLYRPINKYRLGGVNMLALQPTSQPTPKDINKATSVKYEIGGYDMASHTFLSNGVYKLYYQFKEIQKDETSTVSDKGTILIADNKEMKNALEFELSLFTVDQLTKSSRIQLNDFAYEESKVIYGPETKVRGTTLRYTSYNPKELASMSNYGSSSKSENCAQLPIIEDRSLDFLKGNFDNNKTLVEEHKDNLFVGNEFLIAAYDNKVYLYEIIPIEASSGGFWLRRNHDKENDTSEANPEMLAFNRLTSIVNVSFMFLDKDDQTNPYFVKGDVNQTLKNFKTRYGLDISNLKCPYAAIDGINRTYYVNDITLGTPNTTDESRLVLWRKIDDKSGYKGTEDVNGQVHTKEAIASGDIVFNYESKVRRGYGIKGNSYSVIFPGTANQTRGKDVTFWIEVDGTKIKVSVSIDSKTEGIAFLQNVAHHLVVFIPAQAFADEVKKLQNPSTRRSSSDNDYAELRLSSDCIAFK